MTHEEIEKRFSCHAPKQGQHELYVSVRAKAKELAYLINDACPEGREKCLAITNLEEAVFWANAGIARDGE